MHKLTFFPIGNADCCRIDLSGGQKLLFDYAAMRCENDSTDRRIDLPRELRADLKAANRNHFEVVAFTHLDDDHIHGASESFRLDHAEKYRGEGRIVIETLWVPAAVIIEDGCEDEARIIQAEARYRLKQGKGIRVFSRPDKLTEWLRQQNLSLADRQHLITDAGLLIPGYSLDRMALSSSCTRRSGVAWKTARWSIEIQIRLCYRRRSMWTGRRRS